MKQSKTPFVLAALGLVLAGAAAAIFWPKGSRDAGEGIGGSPEESSAPVAPVSGGGVAESRPERETPGGVREVVAAPRGNVDPEYQAALAGFRGRIVLQDGKPAPDRQVKLYRFDPSVVMLAGVSAMSDKTIDPEIDAGDARTASDGTFAISGVYPGTAYALLADATGEVPTFRVLERSPGPGEVVDLGDIPLRLAATVTGILQDENGKPIVGGLVRALDVPGVALAAMPLERFDPEGAIIARELPDRRTKGRAVFEFPAWAKRRFEELPIPKARSDENGKFVLTGVDPGVNALMITSRGLSSFVNPTLRLKAGQTKDVGTIKLEPGESVRGQVVDGTGAPVVGAEVLVAQTSPLAPVDLALRAPKSDEKGRFATTGLKPGQVTVAARRSPKDPWTISNPTSIGTEVIVKIPTVATLTLRLTSKVATAIEKPRLKVFPSQADDPFALLGLLAPLELGDRLEVLEGGVLRLRDLCVGEYRLVVDCVGHASAQALIELKQDQLETIELVPEATVSVLVTDTQGKPVRSAQVHYSYRQPKTRRTELPLHGGSTDAEGRLTIVVPTNLESLAVSASHPRYSVAHANPKPPLTEVRILLPLPGAIQCTVTSNGKPADPTKYHVAVFRSWMDEASRGALPPMARLALPNAEGVFTMTGLAPGKYMLNVGASVAEVNSPGKFYSNVLRGSRIDQTVEATVTSGQTTSVSIDTDVQAPVQGPAARVFGTAFVDGRPAAGMKVRGWGRRQMSAEVDAAGRFDFGRVHAGQVNLALVDNEENGYGSGLWSSWFELEAEKDRELKIDVQTMTVRVTVLGADGLPVAGARVSGSGSVGESDPKRGYENFNVQAVTGTDGRVEIPRVRAKPVTFSAEKPKVGRSAPMHVKPEGGSAQVELRLIPTVEIAGRVDLVASGITLKESWASLSFVPVDTPDQKVARRMGAAANFQADGKIMSSSLPEGTYRVTAWVDGKQYVGTSEVVIRAPATSDLVIVLKLAPNQVNK